MSPRTTVSVVLRRRLQVDVGTTRRAHSEGRRSALRIRGALPISLRVAAVPDNGGRTDGGAHLAASPRAIRRLAANGWTAGIVVACVLMIFAPPTITEVVVWLFVSSALAVLMARVRGQARLARRDPLTRPGNRRAFNERFAATTGDVVLGIGDLDGFKAVNDVHGHLLGDACLTAVGASLARHARRADEVFRWGGDEFAVLLPATPADAAGDVFARLEAAVAAEVSDPSGAPVGITFGWAAGGPGSDLHALTEAADVALRARKAPRPRRAAA
jgi:diguanylate cyclase (GGDEF)-like protein